MVFLNMQHNHVTQTTMTMQEYQQNGVNQNLAFGLSPSHIRKYRRQKWCQSV